MKSDIFLEKARLGPRNKVLVEHDEKRHLPGIKRRFEAYTHVDLAHVVMLVEHDRNVDVGVNYRMCSLPRP